MRTPLSTLGAEDTTAPYAVAWNTALASNGPHTLIARARVFPYQLLAAHAMAVDVVDADEV